jgi:hypothetical protein
MKESIDLQDAKKLEWDEIISKSDQYRIDSIVGALGMKANQAIFNNGWENVPEIIRIVYVIEELCRHCYMDGIESFVSNAENEVKINAVNYLS